MCCWYLFEFNIFLATIDSGPTINFASCFIEFIRMFAGDIFNCVQHFDQLGEAAATSNGMAERVLYCLMLPLPLYRCESTVSSVEISFSSENNKKTFGNIVLLHGGAREGERESEAKTPKQKHEKFICFVRFGDVPFILYTIFHQSHWCVGDGCARR